MKRLLKQMALLLSVTVILIFGYCQQRDTQCVDQIRKCKQDIHLYAISHKGEFPKDIKSVGLHSRCPTSSKPYVYQSYGKWSDPKNERYGFILFCSGKSHPTLGANQPATNESWFIKDPKEKDSYVKDGYEHP